MRLGFVCLLLLLLACNKIETAQTLNQSDHDYIRSLNLLEEGETIIKFYSEYKLNVAGNFITNRRMAQYWIDERDSEKNHIESAYYKDIAAIEMVQNVGLTYSPYLLVKRKDGTQFKVSVDGDEAEIRSFCEAAVLEWNRSK